MALSLNNNLEGGTDGTTITTANSGGTSGDAFDTVTIGTGVTVKFDSTNPAHGVGLDMALTQPATIATSYVQWDTSLGTLATNQTLYGRFYLVIPSPATACNLLTILHTGTALCTIFATVAHNLRLKNGAGTAVGTASTLALTAGTLYRVEFQFTGIGSSTAGAGQVNIYLGDSDTASDTACNTSAQNFGTTAPNQIRFGTPGGTAPASSAVYFDAINVNDSGFPGPEIVSTPLPDLIMAPAHR